MRKSDSRSGAAPQGGAKISEFTEKVDSREGAKIAKRTFLFYFIKRATRFIQDHLYLRIKLQRLHIFEGDNGPDWVVAYDEMDAIAVSMEWTGCGLDEVDTYSQVRDLSMFTINDYDASFKKELHIPLFGRAEYSEKVGWRIIAPAWCWVIWNGRGFLCSTEY